MGRQSQAAEWSPGHSRQPLPLLQAHGLPVLQAPIGAPHRWLRSAALRAGAAARAHGKGAAARRGARPPLYAARGGRGGI